MGENRGNQDLTGTDGFLLLAGHFPASGEMFNQPEKD
jgi:hypothetical protein